MRYSDPKVEAGKKAILDEVMKQWRDLPPWTGPLALRVLAVFAIPKSWPRKTREAAIDGKVFHIADPDYDQIVKLVMDALRGKVYVDDNQVAGFLPGSFKRYGFPERTEVEIALMAQDEGAVTPGQHRIEAKEAERAIAVERGLLGRTRDAPKLHSDVAPVAPRFRRPGAPGA